MKGIRWTLSLALLTVCVGITAAVARVWHGAGASLHQFSAPFRLYLPIGAGNSPLNSPSSAQPLSDVAFPSQAVVYPTSWPSQFVFPADFTLVEAVSQGSRSGRTGWGIKLRYKGSPSAAADRLASFFGADGWLVADRAQGPNGALNLLLEKAAPAEDASFLIDVDTDDPSFVRILGVVYR